MQRRSRADQLGLVRHNDYTGLRGAIAALSQSPGNITIRSCSSFLLHPIQIAIIIEGRYVSLLERRRRA